MKAIARTITVLAAALLIAAVPVLAEEGGMGQQQQNFNNSECLLVAKNCPTDSIQERIQRIQGEINKGTSVYTNDELRRLNNELEDAQKFLEVEMTNGA
ncbi:MAG: hypothetical protein JJE30_18800 [Desulfuromonadales bacterium]|nr:hypothetical protein [Desulfuromonadales bacterium]